MMKILILDRFHPEALKFLKQNTTRTIEHRPDSNITKDEEVEILLIRSKNQINQTTKDFFPNLKLIVSGTSGFDHIDYQFCNQNNITACYSPEANQYSAAELTWALLLSASRNLLTAQHKLQSGKWREGLQLGHEIYGKDILIIGLGRIGSLVAQYAKAFGLNVQYYDPYVKNSNYQEVELIEGFQSCDIVSMHTPLTKETNNIITADLIASLHANSICINTARAEIIDPQAYKMLNTRTDIMYIADVFLQEPLTTAPNYAKFYTPHIGAYTEEAFLRASMACAKNAVRYLDSLQPVNILPPQVEWARHL